LVAGDIAFTSEGVQCRVELPANWLWEGVARETPRIGHA